MNMPVEFLRIEPLIGATSVVSGSVLYNWLKSSQNVGLTGKVLTGAVWLLFLVVGMIVSDAEDKIVPILFWMLQLTTAILLLVIIHPKASTKSR